MQAADVGEGARLIELIGKFLVGIERSRPYAERVQNYIVRNIVLVGPGDRRPFRNGQRCWAKLRENNR